MTNEEKARVLSNKGCLGAYISRDTEALYPTEEDRKRLSIYGACMEAMQWKDKERKELWRITRNHYQEWAEEQIAQEKQQLIDKAAEWLRMTMDFFNNGEFNTEKFVNDFKQAMKGE